jgi:hypothetical protein
LAALYEKYPEKYGEEDALKIDQMSKDFKKRRKITFV